MLTIERTSPAASVDRYTGTTLHVQSNIQFCANPVVNAAMTQFRINVYYHAAVPLVGKVVVPVLICFQGMGAPMEWNTFVISEAAKKGYCVVLVETPLSGSRGVCPSANVSIAEELHHVMLEGVTLPELLPAVIHRGCIDVMEILNLLPEIMIQPLRTVLFGISLGSLLASKAFYAGYGDKLLCVIGHPDLERFAISYANPQAWLVTSEMGSWVERAAEWIYQPWGTFFDLIRTLKRMVAEGLLNDCNPVRGVPKVPGPVRCLLGARDPLVAVEDAQIAMRNIPDGEVFVVPDMAHGGAGFEDKVRYFLATQL